MGWLTKLFGVFRIKWVPYVAILWVTSVGGTALWGYMKGKAVVEKRIAAEINASLQDQLKRLERVQGADLKTVARILREEQEIKDEMEAILPPDLHPDCSDEWLRAFNEAVRATGEDTEEP